MGLLTLTRRAPAREGQSPPPPPPLRRIASPRSWTGRRRPDRQAQRGFGVPSRCGRGTGGRGFPPTGGRGSHRPRRGTQNRPLNLGITA
jgi:hypothetical protein